MIRKAAVDSASGAKDGDAFGAAMARRDGGIGVLEAVRRYAPPFNPSVVIAELADWFKEWGVHEVHGDRYAGEFPREAFRSHGLVYITLEQDRSQLYLELLALVNAGRVRLLDHPDLLRELRGLERRRGSGRDRVDHRRGSHDDLANAAAAALVLATSRTRDRLYTGLSVGEVTALQPSADAALERIRAEQRAAAAQEIEAAAKSPTGWFPPGR
jgi:hypothetical protein